MGDGVTTIGKDAFYLCTSLQSVIISDNVTTIGVGAFSYCYALQFVILPDSVTSINSIAFRGSDALTEAYMSETARSNLGLGLKKINHFMEKQVSI